MSGEGSSALRMSGVTHAYGARKALAGIDLDIPPGAMTGLIGPDGVGKSTLLGLAAGVRRVQTGRIETLGGDIAERRHRERVAARIAYMPQGLGGNLYASLSVVENIDFFGRLFGLAPDERAARIETLLKSTGLDPFPDRAAGQLSGGMKQKLALCCALIHDPDLLLLDEPTTGIDPLARRQFWELIDRIRDERPGMTVVTATASMSEAERFETLVALHDGRILATGSPEAVRDRTDAETLEEAFIALLPAEARERHRQVRHRPRTEDGDGPAIVAEGLSKRFGSFTAVDEVSFEIERGEIFGFIGSNGCGKTTTMKMLTGLLEPSAGRARIFGEPVESGGLAMRRRVGYMSQSFSLYGELTVRQNLRLHAEIFQLPRDQRADRIAELLDRFDLAAVADERPGRLPLGLRQRLQLAVAVLHRPELLILDEPTSGVDPVARDRFWEILIGLSRDDKVTIFISTHFMNEAARCDRISLMHEGRVLAIGTPQEIREERGAETLEDAFVAHLEGAAGEGGAAPGPPTGTADRPAPSGRSGEAGERPAGRRPLFSPATSWAFARREATELLRDPIRLSFALLGPVVLMLAMGFGISFDVEDLSYAAYDEDRSRESRTLLHEISSSRYFDEHPPATSMAELDRRLVSGEIGMAIVVPPQFGHDLVAGRRPEVAVWLDGANTARAETARGYVQGVFEGFLAGFAREETGVAPEIRAAGIEPRFRYNQAFLSARAIPPGVLTMMLMMIPTMLTALGVVREKEMGSITNFYAAPVSRLEFLIGKQLPYIAVAMASFVILVGLMLTVFGLRIEGSAAALVLGALVYTTAATAFGLVVSTFVRSQIAAVFASAIIVMIPTVNFSGMIYPVSTLEGAARLLGEGFPAYYFQKISAGVFNKGLGLGDLWQNHAVLAAFCLAFWAASALLLARQER